MKIDQMPRNRRLIRVHTVSYLSSFRFIRKGVKHIDDVKDLRLRNGPFRDLVQKVGVFAMSAVGPIVVLLVVFVSSGFRLLLGLSSDIVLSTINRSAQK